eukprot:scaffold3558_cov60-Phaeocystis_antarctica.AAC.5
MAPRAVERYLVSGRRTSATLGYSPAHTMARTSPALCALRTPACTPSAAPCCASSDDEAKPSDASDDASCSRNPAAS